MGRMVVALALALLLSACDTSSLAPSNDLPPESGGGVIGQAPPPPLPEETPKETPEDEGPILGFSGSLEIEDGQAFAQILNDSPIDAPVGIACYSDPTGLTANQYINGPENWQVEPLLRRGRSVMITAVVPCGIAFQCDTFWHYTEPPIPPDFNAHWLITPLRGMGQECEPTPPVNREPKPMQCDKPADSFFGFGSWEPVDEMCIVYDGLRAFVEAFYQIDGGMFDGDVQIVWKNGAAFAVKATKHITEKCGPIRGEIRWNDPDHCHRCGDGHVNRNARYFLRFVDAENNVVKEIPLDGKGCEP